jgi:hypothetical protein
MLVDMYWLLWLRLLIRTAQMLMTGAIRCVNVDMAATLSINIIRITTLNTSTLRIITLRIKATADRTPILGLRTIIRSMTSL